MNKKKKNILIVYTVVLFILWTIFEILFKDKIDNYIKNEYLSQFIKSGIIKNLVWTLPAFILIKKLNDDMHIKLKNMFINKINIKHFVMIFLAITIYVLVGDIINNGMIKISPNFKLSDLIIILFVGLTEEMVFRGLVLNATLKDNNKNLCIFINSILFLLIHFPRWISEGILVSNLLNLSFLSIIVLSSLFSYLFIDNKNIIVPILVHMYYDLLVFMLI